MRNVAAVIVPWIVWGLLDNGVYLGILNVAPDSFGRDGALTTRTILVTFLALRAVYSILAGWLGVRIAGSQGGATRALIVLLAATGVLAQIVNWNMYPVWFHLVFLASIVPCAGFGISLGGRRTS